MSTGHRITEQLDQLIQLLSSPPPSRVRWVTVDELAEILNEPGAKNYLKGLLNPNIPARSQREYIHPHDLIKAGGKMKIRYCEIPIKGVSYPRIEKKPLGPKASL